MTYDIEILIKTTEGQLVTMSYVTGRSAKHLKKIMRSTLESVEDIEQRQPKPKEREE